MANQPSTSSIFIIIAVIIAILSPFIIFFWPLIQLITFRFDSDNLLMTVPAKNYYLLISAFIIFISIFVLLAIKRTKWMFVSISGLAAISALLIYFSSLSYIQIHPNFVRIQDFHTENTYPMIKMEKIIQETSSYENGRFIFHTQDGEIITITETPLFDSEKQGKLKGIAKQNGTEYIVEQID